MSAPWKKKRSKTKIAKRLAWFLTLLLIAGVTGAVIYLNSRPNEKTQATIEQKDLGYSQIRDNGTLLQKKNLLHELKSKRIAPNLIPVKLDTNRKISEIADSIIEYPDVEEVDRVFAVKAKLLALGTSYQTAVGNGLNDPFIADQLVGNAKQYLDDPNRDVAREAHLSLAKAMISETIRRQILGGTDKVEDTMLQLFKTFPDDDIVIAVTKDLFTVYRAFDADASVSLAKKIAEVTDQSESPETQQLSRFMKDIILLFDTGIGNYPTINSVKVSDVDFMNRMNQLNDNLEAGPTVMVQLENGISFFERQGKHELAVQLCNRMLEKADQRAIPEAAEFSKSAAERGLVRNSLVGTEWDFATTDYFGDSITNDKFQNRIVMLVFYKTQAASSIPFVQTISQLANQFLGQAVDFVMVEVGQADQAPLASQNKKQWVTIRSQIDEPHKYLKQCPTKKFPYAVLIDRRGIVKSINFAFDETRTKIEDLLAR